jgi:glyoxylase-like metal-dependent hydrolase (beta-lactamase superfamily II)
MSIAEIRLYVCDGGGLEVPVRTQILGGGAAGEMMKTPIPWFLITHPRGNIIVDGGNAPEVAIDAKKHWGAITEMSTVHMTPDQAVLPTLARMSIEPASIRWVVQTHLHSDHTGAVAVIDRLPGAQVLVTRSEYEWARAPDGLSALGYCPADYVKSGIDWVMLEEGDDGWDLYGDGTVRCWRTPGHTPGHMSREVRLGSGATYILAADAANTMAHVAEEVLPGFSLDLVGGARSIRRLRRVADRAQAVMVPGHDPDLWPKRKHAPEYYS